MIKKVGSKYALYSLKTGKRLGMHGSKRKALAQERAIQVAKQIKAKRSR